MTSTTVVTGAAVDATDTDDVTPTAVVVDRATGSARSTGGAGERRSHHAVTASSSTAPAPVATRASEILETRDWARARQDGRGSGRSRSGMASSSGAPDGGGEGEAARRYNRGVTQSGGGAASTA